MRKMSAQNNYRKILGYLFVQRVIFFLAFYEYLNRGFPVVYYRALLYLSVILAEPVPAWRGSPESLLTHPYTPLKRGLDSEQVGMTTKNDTNSYEYDANVNIALHRNHKKKGA